MRKLFYLLTICAMVWMLGSCGSNSGESNSQESMDQQEAATDRAMDTTSVHGNGKEYTSAYVCPMHCEGSGSDEPGKCPVCGMDYVAQAEHIKDGHSHEN
ncbi:MAG: heavy metal-binding domain-containing protein [Saprospiraceae bacterium]